MNKIIKILNDYNYKVLIGEEYINLYDPYDVVIIYDRNNRTVQTLRNVDVYITEKFIQLIAEIEKE